MTKKKKKKKKKKKRKIIVVGVGLESFVDWVDLNSSEPAEEREGDMSSLAAGFVAWMRKRAVSAQGETTPDSEVSSGKRPKRSGQDKEAQKSLVVITVDSLKRAPDALLALEGASQDASLEDRVPAEGPPNVDEVVG